METEKSSNVARCNEAQQAHQTNQIPLRQRILLVQMYTLVYT